MTRRLTTDLSQVLSSRAVDRVAGWVTQQASPEAESKPPPVVVRAPVPAPCDAPKEPFITVTRSPGVEDERSLINQRHRLERKLQAAKKQGMTKAQRREITVLLHLCEDKLAACIAGLGHADTLADICGHHDRYEGIAMDWEEVYREPTDIMERLRLTDGWLYRNRVVADGSAQSAGGYDWDVVITYVPGELPPPVNVEVPTVLGTGTVGETLTCTMGEWQNDPDTYAYAWASDSDPVGTDTNTYVIADTDVGKSITCVVTATNASGSTPALPSNAIAVS